MVFRHTGIMCCFDHKAVVWVTKQYWVGGRMPHAVAVFDHMWLYNLYCAHPLHTYVTTQDTECDDMTMCATLCRKQMSVGRRVGVGVHIQFLRHTKPKAIILVCSMDKHKER